MSLSIEIQKKEKQVEQRKVNKPEDVFNLKEVQEIKDAICTEPKKLDSIN